MLFSTIHHLVFRPPPSNCVNFSLQRSVRNNTSFHSTIAEIRHFLLLRRWLPTKFSPSMCATVGGPENHSLLLSLECSTKFSLLSHCQPTLSIPVFSKLTLRLIQSAAHNSLLKKKNSSVINSNTLSSNLLHWENLEQTDSRHIAPSLIWCQSVVKSSANTIKTLTCLRCDWFISPAGYSDVMINVISH